MNELQQSMGSLTTKESSTYQLGIRSSKDWICEEILFLKPGQPFNYTAITKTPAKLIRITKIEMLRHFTPEYLNNLLNTATKRYKHN